MKKTLLTLVACFVALSIFAQNKSLPSANVKTLEGQSLNVQELGKSGKITIISFWATWCKPCVNELTAINEVYGTWKEETGVKLIAISIDDARTMASVAPFINGKGWDFDVYLDPNGDFKRAMNVNMVPHTFLLNGKGEVVDQHTSFAPGDEDKLFEKVKKTAAGQPLD